LNLTGIFLLLKEESGGNRVHNGLDVVLDIQLLILMIARMKAELEGDRIEVTRIPWRAISHSLDGGRHRPLPVPLSRCYEGVDDDALDPRGEQISRRFLELQDAVFQRELTICIRHESILA